MSRNEAVSPLRINKTPTASPTKGSGRPLSEIGPTEQRRNSPSWNQSTKKPYLVKESSPFRDSSPFTNSPRLFWKEQTVSPKSRFESSENEHEGSSPTVLSPKRNSIENLKKQSRVKNSNMFAREQKYEYDPAAVQPLDRPLATGRPLSTAIQGNAYGGNGLNGLRLETEGALAHRHRESLSKIPTLSPSKQSPTKPHLSSPFSSPSKDKPSPPDARASPTKSSLVSNGRFNSPHYNPDESVLTDDDELKHQTPRPLRRHAKSVTFDTAPPLVTEFEMVTPDPSVASVSREGSYESETETEDEMSFDQDDSFDASLEDTDKTPVVLPEDWRHMSPDAANTSLTDEYDDVFDQPESSPAPSARTNGAVGDARRGSTQSDGESRPLPPLPGVQLPERRRDSSIGLSAAAERVSDARRNLPPPPKAAGISKADLLNFRESSMSLEDRLRLMNFDDNRTNTSTPTQETHDQKKVEEGVEVHVDEIEVTETEVAVDEQKTPRISRESILRRVKSRTFDEYEEGDSYEYDAEYSPERSYGDLADLDPDVAIPSREASSNFDEVPGQLSAVPESEADSVLDAYSYGDVTDVDGVDMGEADATELSVLDEYERESSVIRHPVKQELVDDDESRYSTSPSPHPEEQPTSQSTIDSSGPPTPTPASTSPAPEEKPAREDELFSSFDAKQDVDLDVDPVKCSLTTAPSPMDTAPRIDAMRDFLRRPATPEQDSVHDPEADEEPGTPDSVIRHPVAMSPPPQEDSPEIPQREATIRGAGGKLKTRPSLIPDEVDMAATRRIVSGTHAPPVPERSPKRQSLVLEMGHVEDEDSQISISNKENRMLDLSLGDLNLGEESHDLSFGLDREFDHIIATQKKGYLMRENTKMVVASSRHFSDEKRPMSADGVIENTSKANQRKSSAERKPAWTKEPWNGKPRRKSIRTASGRRTRTSLDPAPPLPGQDSAVAAGLDSVAEQGDEEFEDGEERGRVFVKVVGVKDLDLPLPKNERTQFQLTLDNGLHCVTTAWLELGKSAPIGQEFELVVLDDLEFQLTLQTKLEPPPVPQITAAPVKAVNHKKSQSAFRNLLSSPKKRREQERKAQEEAERLALQEQQEAQAALKRNQQATAWDLLHDLVGEDGSFGRAYVCLNNYEAQAYGRPYTVDVPCFNEWAVDNSSSSVKSKRGGVVRRPPYRVGKLTLQLLYVPKPKGATDEDMPKSMNACIRELKAAEQIKDISFEGILSQQGGDCPYWRRRFFRLDGTKLTAYHESTRQPRATINLAKASKLLDDKSALQQPSATKAGGRRKSGFAEDEEGYMFVEEGFRIRFANGEVIDFYADSREQKEAWMKVLTETVGKDLATNKGWAAMVLDKERKEKAARSQPGAPAPPAKPLQETGNTRRPSHQRTQSDTASYNKSVPCSPVKGYARTQSNAPTPPAKDVRFSQAPLPRPRETGSSGRREQVRSMIF
ncbi:hypothetical protein IAQ61_007092 [Plenodomus lingam]|uniref:uncharacterized protein n=1 Tax=Leptosphaeria maculans TaxID=5022 RepID=UPI00331F012F|nr:hypothetical protein IAQ61_007092 [Plenodomus lingam]